MSFLDTVRRAKSYLEEQGRVSLRGLRREFELDDEALDELVDELVDVQQIAAREGKVLSWIGAASAASPEQEPEAETVAEAEQTPEPERRHLTVLFCDLVDSTRLAAGMDPEDWREVVRDYQQAADEVIARFGGHVAQYLGDGLLVYFGWPQAHEDDGERAVRAGLGIVDAITAGDASLSVRIGIHTGPVVVGEMGDGASRETLAMGDTTNVAARLEGIAQPNTVVISAATLRLVAGIFVTSDLGEQALKGLPEPVHVHRAERTSGIRSRLDVTAASALTPFIGRDQELMLLEDRWSQVEEGWGQAVLISGEAGIGKSRLMQAFRERLAEQAHTWLECRASPYTQDSAFYPVLELQRLGLGFRAEDPAEAKLEGIEAGLDAVSMDLAEGVPLMAGLHGVPLGDRYEESDLSPEGRRKRTLELLDEWLLRLGERQPLVLLVEDLHWMDPSTLELMGRILDRIAGTTVLLLLTHRPDFEPTWGARSHLTPMLLSRLTRAHLADLVRKAARGRDLPEAWVEEILRRSDGVPLFAEELTRTVLETNPEPPTGGETPALQIPDTLQDSLMARLDALGPVKELAQLGAVLGREFSYDLLLKVSPTKEAELQSALASAVEEELFYQRGTPPEASYLFKHALIRDAAYESLLRGMRQRQHRRVAETLIERMPHVSEEQPELVAQHLSEAGDIERAIPYWKRAADQALAGASFEEAIHHLRRGIGLLNGLPEGPRRDERELELQVVLGSTLIAARGFASPETGEAWQRAHALCGVVGSSLQVAGALLGLSWFRQSRSDLDTAIELGEEILAVGRSTNDDRQLLAGYVATLGPSFFKGHFKTCREYSDTAIDIYDPSRHAVGLAMAASDGLSASSYSAWALWSLGFPDQAYSRAEAMLAHARELAQPFGLAWTLNSASMLYVLANDWQRAERASSESIEFCRRHDIPMMLGISMVAHAFSSSVTNDSLEEAEEGLHVAAATGNLIGAPLLMGMIARIHQQRGRSAEALEVAENALAAAKQLGQPFWSSELTLLKAETTLTLDEHTEDEAEALFKEAVEIAERQEAKSLELRATTSLARLWQRQGKRAKAHDLLQPVYDWFTEGFDTQDLKDAKALLAELA